MREHIGCNTTDSVKLKIFYYYYYFFLKKKGNTLSSTNGLDACSNPFLFFQNLEI